MNCPICNGELPKINGMFVSGCIAMAQYKDLMKNYGG